MTSAKAMTSDNPTTPEEDRGKTIKEIKIHLYASTVGREWQKVAEIYGTHPEVHATKITLSGDTAMHFAITHGAEEEVLQLFDEVAKTSTAKEALRARNKLENTPLHYAAGRGFRQICERIARVDESLVFERNKEGETPLFLAALYGRKEAFLYLNSVCFKVECPTTELRMPWRREDGDTILHVTIQREYFELAFLIIHRYKEDITLATSVNAKGMTPLHVLANKPSAFKSATGLRWWDKLLYYWLPVKQLEDRSSSQAAVDIKDEKQQESIDTKKQPWNSCTCFTCKALQPLRLSGSCCLERIRKIKQKHEWGAQIMDLLSEHYKYQFMESGSGPSVELIEDQEELMKIESIRDKHSNSKDQQSQKDMENKSQQDILRKDCKKWDERSQQGQKSAKKDKKYTPFLLAAKYGLIELMRKILCVTPVAIHDRTTEHKNVVHVAVEKRQPHILVELQSNHKDAWDSLIDEVDIEGNNALHLAAKLSKYKPWEIPGSAMQMQWEIKFYRFVQTITPHRLNLQTNKNGETPLRIFAESHKDLVKESGEWLKDTSESCSAVAILIAGITFTACITVPGGTNNESGLPVLDGQPAFQAFAVALSIALWFAIWSLLMFLAIRISRKQPKDFLRYLPIVLLLGSFSMFVSLASLLISFCSALFLVFLEHRLKYGIISIFTVIGFPVAFYAMSHFPLYVGILNATFMRVPQPRYVGDKLYTIYEACSNLVFSLDTIPEC